MQDKNLKKKERTKKNSMLSYLEVSTLHIFHGKTLSLSMEELQQGLKHCKKKSQNVFMGKDIFHCTDGTWK